MTRGTRGREGVNSTQLPFIAGYSSRRATYEPLLFFLVREKWIIRLKRAPIVSFRFYPRFRRMSRLVNDASELRCWLYDDRETSLQKVLKGSCVNLILWKVDRIRVLRVVIFWEINICKSFLFLVFNILSFVLLLLKDKKKKNYIFSNDLSSCGCKIILPQAKRWSF